LFDCLLLKCLHEVEATLALANLSLSICGRLLLHAAIHWRLSDELLASISLFLPFFDKQFEYSLSL
jgi:hypothetical protein